MTAMELKCLKMDLVEELLSIDDKDTLNRVKNYLKKLNNKIRTKAEEEETEYISKEEILAGSISVYAKGTAGCHDSYL